MNKPQTRRWDWPLAALFILIFFTSPGRLLLTHWAADLGRIQTAAVLGAALGLALGVSRFRPLIRRLLLIGYTLGVLPWQITAVISGETSLLARLASMWGRLFFAWQALWRGEAVEDPLLFIALASLFYWLMAAACGQRFFERGKLLSALIPPTLPLLVIQYYDGSRAGGIWLLAFYFFIILLILGRVNLLENRERWQRQGVFLGSEPGFDLNNGLLMISTLMIFAAWLAPAPATAIPAAARWWRTLTAPLKQSQDDLGDAFAALRGQPSVSGESYGSSLALGSSAGKGQNELFRVITPPANLPRFYWRVRAYDLYEDGLWHTSEALARPFSPGEQNFSLAALPAASGEFTFEWRSSDQRSLILPGQALWVSRASNLIFFPLPENQIDPLYLQAAEPLRAGDQYRARAGLNNPSLQTLRAASGEIPGWVRERYLNVPAGLRPQLRGLALEITRGQENDFDKSAAITEWLRQNMRYSDTIEPPPPGSDPVAWFLFTWKSGYCNYYASAQVLLLRSLGIPARMVVGYAQGQRAGANTYIVRGAQAHAWPEVYFSGVGWVEFEPTVSQPSLNRPSEVNLALDPQNAPAPDQENQQELRREGAAPLPDAALPVGGAAAAGNLSMPLAGVGVMIAALAALIFLLRRQARRSWRFSPRMLRRALQKAKIISPAWLERWIGWSELSPEERAFQAVNQSLTWLGAPPPISATPAERAAALKRLAPPLGALGETLTAQVEALLFSPQPGDARLAQKASWRLRWQTLRFLLSRWLYGA
ncbi:MAG: hypothetical protein OHK0031_13040 [Anaerolineales bacterium]